MLTPQEKRHGTIAGGKPSVGLGILSWKARETLRASLESHRAAGLLEMFDDSLIFFQEISDEDRALAAEFGIRAVGVRENLGIMGGIVKIAELLTTDYVLFLENDVRTIADNATIRRQLTAALDNMESGAVKYTSLDDGHYHAARQLQGKRYEQYVSFHPSLVAGVGDSPIKRIKRTLLPRKADRAAWGAVYMQEGALFPHLMKWLPNGHWAVSTRVVTWKNRVPFFPRQWFLRELIPLAKSKPSARLVNGKSDLERDVLNRRWWREQPWRVGISDQGLFVHSRMDRPQGDEKTSIHPIRRPGE